MAIIAFKGLGKAYKYGKGSGGRTQKVMKEYTSGQKRTVYTRPGQPTFKMKPQIPKTTGQGKLFKEVQPKKSTSKQLTLPFSESARKKLGVQQRKTEKAGKKKLKENLKILKESKKFEKKKLKRTFVGLDTLKKKLKGEK